MTRGNQIKWVVVVALALALVGITFYPKSEPAERTEQALRPPVVSTLDPPASGGPGTSPPTDPSSPSAAPSSGPSPGTASSTSPAPVGKTAAPPLDPRAAARRQRVLDALASASSATAPSAGTPGAAGSSARVYPEGTMADKTGNFKEGVAVLNRDFIPLVAECFDHAHERNPRLGGMLALSIKLASAEGVGGIIESVEAAPRNEVHDSEMIECARQSAFSVEFPESATTGRKDVELTIPLGPPPSEDAGPGKTP